MRHPQRLALTFALLLLSAPLKAQTRPAELDSLKRQLDSLEAKHARLDSLLKTYAHAYHKAYHPTKWYGAVLASGVVANRVFGLDRDPGGYEDKWFSFDKYQHFTIAMFLVERSEMMRVELRWSVPMTCAAAAGWEWSQGYFSGKDVAASCAGAVSAAGFRWLVRHIPERGHRFGY